MPKLEIWTPLLGKDWTDLSEEIPDPEQADEMKKRRDRASQHLGSLAQGLHLTALAGCGASMQKGAFCGPSMNELMVVAQGAEHFAEAAALCGYEGEDKPDNVEDFLSKCDLIAKEGRKYGLNICLATQRPRDLPEGVLSQMGTLIVHRLTNGLDREIVERACGEIDRSASAFLPNLQPGEAALIGVDFPIPMTIQIKWPDYPPQSSGPDYQEAWKFVVPSSLPPPAWMQ